MTFLAAQHGPKATDNGMRQLVAERSFDDLAHPDILVVPGGVGTRAMMTDTALLDWVRAARATSQWTCSVCTASLVLGTAGILDDLEATTHWMATDALVPALPLIVEPAGVRMPRSGTGDVVVEVVPRRRGHGPGTLLCRNVALRTATEGVPCSPTLNAKVAWMTSSPDCNASRC